MFLFTTPTQSPAAVPPGAGGPVVDAIRRGAAQTGTDFGYLLDTAKRESALDPAAKAPTSSATGLFQFIEQTWLGLVKSEGGKLGLSDLASTITPRSDGGLAVENGDAKQAILKLREDPTLSAVLAGTLTQQNRESLATATGREPSAGELYMAHVLGARGAADLIRAAATDPDRKAVSDLPDAAAANRSIFYDRGGRARSAADVYAVLAGNRSGEASAASPAAPMATSLPRIDGPALYGLFQTDRRTGPISDAVAKLWKVGGRTDTSKGAGLSFFPRADGSAAIDASPSATAALPEGAASPVAAAASPTASPSVPLPPPRPRDLDDARGARRAASTPLPAARRRS